MFLDDIVKEQCSSNCLLKMHIHIANISKNIIDALRDVSDISLLSSNLKLEMMNRLKSDLQFRWFKIILFIILCV